MGFEFNDWAKQCHVSVGQLPVVNILSFAASVHTLMCALQSPRHKILQRLRGRATHGSWELEAAKWARFVRIPGPCQYAVIARDENLAAMQPSIERNMEFIWGM